MNAPHYTPYSASMAWRNMYKLPGGGLLIVDYYGKDTYTGAMRETTLLAVKIARTEKRLERRGIKINIIRREVREP